jgi:hypothetical protein
LLRNTNLEDLVLIDLGGMRSVSDTDPYGYHRMRELQEFFLRDLDANFYAAKRVKQRKVEYICPNRSICPPPLKALLGYVMSFDPENGDLSRNIYHRIEEILIAAV